MRRPAETRAFSSLSFWELSLTGDIGQTLASRIELMHDNSGVQSAKILANPSVEILNRHDERGHHFLIRAAECEARIANGEADQDRESVRIRRFGELLETRQIELGDTRFEVFIGSLFYAHPGGRFHRR